MNEILLKLTIEWLPFSKEEFKNAIYNCNNSSSLRSDYILYKYLKVVIENNKCLHKIISKPNKIAYNSSKMFHPIILLNTLKKLIKKVIGKKLQYQPIILNFVHSYQLENLK